MLFRLAVCTTILLAHSAAAEDWNMFARDPLHHSFNAAETKLTRENVVNLTLGWTSRRGAPISAAPTVIGDLLYYGAWDGQFFALDANTGEILWQQFVGIAPSPDQDSCFPGIGVAGQVVVDRGIVYVPGGDSTLYGLDQQTGEIRWKVPLADPASGAFLWSSITKAGDYLYLGIASLADCPLAQGALVRFDLRDPLKAVYKYLIPDEEVGAGIWSTPAYDAETDTVYVTTGTGKQNAHSLQWGSALLAIDGTTLEIKAYYLLPTHSVEEDIEWGSSPTVFTTPGGRKLVAATGKDGGLYVLHATTLAVVWVSQIAVGCICPECGCGSLSTPAYDGRYLYVGAGVSAPELYEDGSVYAFNPDTGQMVWGLPIFGTVIAPMTVANGMVFASTTKGLKVFDSATGTMLFTEARGGIYSQPIVSNGLVYCTYVRGDAVAWRLPE